MLGLRPVVPVTCSAGPEGDAPGHRGRGYLKTETAGERPGLSSARLRVSEEANLRPTRKPEND